MKSVLGLALPMMAALAVTGLGASHLLHREQSPVSAAAPLPGYFGLAGGTLADVPEEQFPRRAQESAARYSARMNQLVHSATYHCEPQDFQLSMLTRLTARMMTRDFDWPQGLIDRSELVCGYCHQRAIVLANILREFGGIADAWAYSVNGHVLVKFSDKTAAYLIDPDYGVGPFRYDAPDDEVRAEMRAVYRAAIYDNTDMLIEMVLSRRDNFPYVSAEHFDMVLQNRRALRAAANAAAWALLAIGTISATGIVFRAVRCRPRPMR